MNYELTLLTHPITNPISPSFYFIQYFHAILTHMLTYIINTY